ncbi:MAG: glycosyltransferase family 4 protein [Anaerolineaceae bacterium]|nr:glycosyltransferase family 4 protein [Anaerolineaceae bacterium]
MSHKINQFIPSAKLSDNFFMEQLSPLKILVITHEYPPIGGGGGRVVKDLCEGMASEKYQFHILTAYWDGLPEWEQRENLVIERIHSHRTEAYRAKLLTMTCFVWKSFWRALKIIKNWHPDLIHAHFAVPGGASAAAAGILTHTPYMFTIHGGDVPGGTPEKTDRWFRYIFPFTLFIWKNASKIITVSQQSQKLAQSHYPVSIDIIPNGLDITHYKQNTIEVHTPPRIIYIGRFSPEKNAAMVPEILSHLKDLDWKCLMIGDGLQMKTIQSLIKKYQLEKRVELTGWITPGDVDRALMKSDILLMPSLREGMPISGLQALACGLALVMSDIGACGDMVDIGSNGFLIIAGNEKGYADALRDLLSSPEKILQFKKNSLQKAREFDINNILDKYRQTYQSIINRNG